MSTRHLALDVSALIGPDAKHCHNRSLFADKFIAIPAESSERASSFLELRSRSADLSIYALRQSGPRVAGMKSFWARAEARLIVNHAVGVVENAGLALDRFTGLPFIPGSALKGVAREAAERKQVQASHLAYVLGGHIPDPDDPSGGTFTQGAVAFLPAFPIADPVIELDIVSCHHPEYYRQGIDAIAFDDESPEPHVFPAVARDTVFRFDIAPTRLYAVDNRKKAFGLPDDFDPTAMAIEWLKSGLAEVGVGAKTSAGYGWFDVSEELQQEMRAKADAEKRRRDDEIRSRQEKERLQAEDVARQQAKQEKAKATAGMSPAEKAAYEIKELDAPGLKARLMDFADLGEDHKSAIYGLLRAQHVQLWIEIKNAATEGNRKERTRWASVVQLLYKMAKSRKEKMP